MGEDLKLLQLQEAAPPQPFSLGKFVFLQLLKGLTWPRGGSSHLASRPGHTPQHCSPARQHFAQWRAAWHTSVSPHPARGQNVPVTVLLPLAARGEVVLHLWPLGASSLWGGKALHERRACHQRPQGEQRPGCNTQRHPGVTWSRLRARRVFPVYTSRR